LVPPGDAGEALESEPISRFDQRTLMLLLSKSGESIGQEAESATFQQLQEGGSPIGELPQLSRIVNLLRGPVIYTAAEVRELQIECQRARGSLQDPQTKALLQDLDVASAKALEREGEIVIYRQTPLQVAGGPRYTIEVLGPQDSTNREIVAQFDNAEFSALWEELGVTEERGRSGDTNLKPVVMVFSS
jgi:hypothetical protein